MSVFGITAHQSTCHSLKCTFNLDFIRVTKNPNGPMFTSHDTIAKLNHNWGEPVMCVEKYAQVTNNSENV